MNINMLKEIDEKILKSVQVFIMCLRMFLPRFKYLSLMCDMVMAGGKWTFLFSVCLKEVTHTSVYSPRFILCYLQVHLSHMTHIKMRGAHT